MWQIRFTKTRHVCHSSSLVGVCVVFWGVLGCVFVLVGF